MRRNLLHPKRTGSAAVLALLACACAADAAPREDERPPNVVLIVVDDMGWMDSPVYGSRYYETPHLERLARAGTTFTDAYTASPVCSPTRASLLTGKSPARLGFTLAWGHRPALPADFPRYAASMPADQRVLTPRSETHLPPEEPTLASLLQEAGYRTGHFGKWHLGLEPEHWPERHGFDVAFHGAPDPGPPSYFAPYGFAAGTIADGPPGEYLTDRLTDEALRFIEANRDRPFFVNLWHFAVHGPWGHREELTRRFAEEEDPRGVQGNPIMASMLASVDASLGRILDRLEALDLDERTIVIVTSDNGGNAYSHVEEAEAELAALPDDHPDRRRLADWKHWAGDRAPTSNAPLREGKGWLYEGGIRVPLVVAWPGRVVAGARSDALVSSPDFLPTVLALTGLGPIDATSADGYSFAPTLLGTDAPPARDAVFAHFPHILPRRREAPGRMAGSAVRAGDWKLIRWYDHDVPVELFDLEHDLGERTNLASERPDVRRALEERLDRHLAATGAYLPRPNPAYVPPAERDGGEPAGGQGPGDRDG